MWVLLHMEVLSLSYFHRSLQMRKWSVKIRQLIYEKRNEVKPMPYKPMKPCHQPAVLNW